MSLRIENNHNGALTIWQGDRLLAEEVLGQAKGRDELAAEVERARRLETIPHILSGAIKELLRTANLPSEGLSPESKRVEWCMGFEDGWNLVEVPMPYLPMLPQTARPSALVHRHTGKTDRGTGTISFAYKLGYQWGESLRRVCEKTMIVARDGVQP